jgi:hypothetical protein
MVYNRSTHLNFNEKNMSEGKSNHEHRYGGAEGRSKDAEPVFDKDMVDSAKLGDDMYAPGRSDSYRKPETLPDAEEPL